MKAWLVVLEVALIAAAGSARAEEQTAVLELASVDPDVPPSTTKQLSEALRAELAKATPLQAPAVLDDLRSGAEVLPDISLAQAALEAGRALSNKRQHKPAAAKFAEARRLLQPVQLELRDYTPITEALLGYAVAMMGANNARMAAATFAELARISPDFRIDEKVYPPTVVRAFDKARQAQTKIPRGRLALDSEPAGAQIFIDEVPLGTTPAVIPLSPGMHAVRVSADGFYSWTENVKSVSYEKVEKTAVLEPNAGMQALKKLEGEVAGAGAPADLGAAGTAVAGALKARAVVVGAAARGVEGFVVSLGYLPAAGSPYLAAAEVKRDLSDVSAVGAELAQVIAEAAKGKAALGDGTPVARVLGAAAPTRPLDFARYNLGLTPGPLPPELLAPRIRESDLALGAGAEPPVVEKKGRSTWWIWTVGAVVVAGVAGGTTYYLVSRPSPPPQFTLQRQ